MTAQRGNNTVIPDPPLAFYVAGIAFALWAKHGFNVWALYSIGLPCGIWTWGKLIVWGLW